jgi:hypothetical protein
MSTVRPLTTSREDIIWMVVQLLKLDYITRSRACELLGCKWDDLETILDEVD